MQAQSAQLVAQQLRRRFAVPPAAVRHLADMGQAIQERPGGDDHRARFHGAPVAQQNAGDAAAFADGQRRHFGLLDAEVRFRLQHLAHAEAVQLLVHLRARRPHGRTAAGIEQAELDADRIGDFAHDAAERVDFPDQVTLGDAADGRIAAHLGDQVQVHGDHGRAQANAGAGARGFTAGVAGADDNDVVPVGHCYHCTVYEDTRNR